MEVGENVGKRGRNEGGKVERKRRREEGKQQRLKEKQNDMTSVTTLFVKVTACRRRARFPPSGQHVDPFFGKRNPC